MLKRENKTLIENERPGFVRERWDIKSKERQ